MADPAKLRKAAKHGDTQSVRGLLELGTDQTAPDARGAVAMHFAAHGGYTEAVKALVAAEGAEACLQARTVGGYTPFMLAKGEAVQTLLLQAGSRFLEQQGRGGGRGRRQRTGGAQAGPNAAGTTGTGGSDGSDGGGAAAGAGASSAARRPPLGAACYSGWVVAMSHLYDLLWPPSMPPSPPASATGSCSEDATVK
eukprot:SAG22_NODE_7624_length_722_cov_1.829856_1_plen_195_part_10